MALVKLWIGRGAVKRLRHGRTRGGRLSARPLQRPEGALDPGGSAPGYVYFQLARSR